MSDYTQITSFGPKDALTTGDPNKKIRGTQLDPEFAAISAAILSKYDSNDLANDATAAALTSATTLITPATLAYALENGSVNIGAAQRVAIVGGTTPDEPKLLLTNEDGAANGKNWLFWVFGNQLRIGTANDADPEAEISTAINVVRSGTTVTQVNLGATSVTANGNEVLTSLDHLTAYKSVDTARSSNTTAANDPHLSVTLEANSTYAFEAFFKWNGGAGVGGLKSGWTIPSGAALEAYFSGVESNGSRIHLQQTDSNTVNSNQSAGVTDFVRITGRVTVSATGGTFAFKWAQVTSDANATTIYAGGWLKATKVG